MNLQSQTAEDLKIPVLEAGSPEEVKDLPWALDKYNHFWLCALVAGQYVEVFIKPRPNYCDRGHYQVHADHWKDDRMTIDHADLFPRMFMSLETAMVEVKRWINWCVFKVSEDVKELTFVNAGRYHDWQDLQSPYEPGSSQKVEVLEV